MQSDELCKHCSKTVPCGKTVLLWDGNFYCQACIDSVCPELWDYARSHDVLEESAPFDKRAQWSNAFRLEALIVLFFGMMFAIGNYTRFGPIGIVYGLGMAAIICSIQSAIQLPMFVRMGRRMLPTVVVKDGQIECYRGGEKAPHSRELSISDAKWRVGKSRQDSGLRNTFVQRQVVVLLIFPLKGRFSFGTDRYACGWSDQMRRIWVGFLTLANVPSTAKRRPNTTA